MRNWTRWLGGLVTALVILTAANCTQNGSSEASENLAKAGFSLLNAKSGAHSLSNISSHNQNSFLVVGTKEDYLSREYNLFSLSENDDEKTIYPDFRVLTYSSNSHNQIVFIGNSKSGGDDTEGAYFAEIGSAEPQFLGLGHSAAISTDGEEIAITRTNNIGIDEVVIINTKTHEQTRSNFPSLPKGQSIKLITYSPENDVLFVIIEGQNKQQIMEWNELSGELKNIVEVSDMIVSDAQAYSENYLGIVYGTTPLDTHFGLVDIHSNCIYQPYPEVSEIASAFFSEPDSQLYLLDISGKVHKKKVDIQDLITSACQTP